AALAAPDKAQPQVTPEPPSVPTPASSPEMAARNALAVEWEQRLDRLCSGVGHKVPNVEQWKRGNGYTVEAVVPAGGRAAWRRCVVAGHRRESRRAGRRPGPARRWHRRRRHGHVAAYRAD